MGGNSISTRAKLRQTKVQRIKSEDDKCSAFCASDAFDPRKHMEEHAAQLCNIQPHHWVLAIGFAKGNGLKIALERVKDGSGKVCGTESSDLHVKCARDVFVYEMMSNKLEINHGSPYSIPYMNNTFERVFLVNNFKEWTDLDSVLQEIYRVMRPGGLMITCCGLEMTKSTKNTVERSQKRNSIADYWEALTENAFVRIKVDQHVHSDTGYKYQAIYAYTRKRK